MRMEVECSKQIFEPTAYGTPYKTYSGNGGNVVVHIKRRAVKAKGIPNRFRVTIEWEDDEE